MLSGKRAGLDGMLQVLLAACLLVIGAWTTAARAESDLYAAEPVALTPVQCGQCHNRHYQDLRQNGGRHRFPCQECHRIIHAYNPARGNYAELMPKCSQCHTAPHGEKQVACKNCHAPHAPAKPVNLAQVKDACGDCHSLQIKQIKEQPSRHAQQKCTACHQEKHGFIPSCFACHKPHAAEQPLAECLGCHPAHQPLRIVFGAETRTELCRGCHASVYGKWTQTPSKHRQVGCTACHPRHGVLPNCTRCHPQPHPEEQMARFPRCLDCHLDVHDLPVKKK